MTHQYEMLRQLVHNEPHPSFWVDLDALDRNLERVLGAARDKKKTIRLATKSVRVPHLIRYLREKSGGVISGLMCYSVAEAVYLAGQGEDDLLVAYPVATEREIKALFALHSQGKKISIVVDEQAHLDLIEEFIPEGSYLPICLDVDVSLVLGGLYHLGVRRSPIRSLSAFQHLLEKIQKSPKVELVGVMAYEAQIAGLTDKNPFQKFLSFCAGWIKEASRPDVRKRRQEILVALKARGMKLDFFNGGGTGSLKSTLEDPSVTEVAVGSGLLQAHLFDYYKGNENEPAGFYAIGVTRIPGAGLVTCQGGGFVASGTPGWDKCPVVYLPQGVRPLKNEGFGEVQTPFEVPGEVSLSLGDPVFLRPAKSGEIAECFSHYYLFRGDKLIEKVPTYRNLIG